MYGYLNSIYYLNDGSKLIYVIKTCIYLKID